MAQQDTLPSNYTHMPYDNTVYRLHVNDPELNGKLVLHNNSGEYHHTVLEVLEDGTVLPKKYSFYGGLYEIIDHRLEVKVILT